MDTFGRSTRPRGFFEAALAIHISPLSTKVRHGILDERFLMADYFMPLPETSAVKDKSENGSCHRVMPLLPSMMMTARAMRHEPSRRRRMKSNPCSLQMNK